MIFVSKFKIHQEEMLLAYEWDPENRILLALGVSVHRVCNVLSLRALAKQSTSDSLVKNRARLLHYVRKDKKLHTL